MTAFGSHRVEEDARQQLERALSFLRRARRFWSIPVVALLVGGLAFGVLSLVKKPTYRSETVILYSEGVRPAESEEQRDSSRSVMVRLKEILTSRSELARVVRELDLYPDLRRAHGSVDAVDELRRHVEFRAPGGDTFSIAFEGTSPSEVQRVTERLAEVVIAQDAELRRKQAVVTRDFLELEKMGTEARLRDAEQALATFMAAHPRFALDATPLATGAAIRASLGAAAVASPLGATAQSARPRPPARLSETSAPAREASDEQARARAALAAARANLADLLAHFTPQYPDVRAAQAEVDRATRRVADTSASAPAPAAEASRVEPARPPAPRGAAPVAPTILGGGATEPRGKDVVTLETEWVKLTRGVIEARQHQDQVEAALFKADINASSETGGHGAQVTIIDPAYLPQRPVPPGRALLLALFLGVSLALGALGAGLRAVFDDRIHDRRDLERLATALVEVPRGAARRAHVAS